jgi:beta-mannanase
MKILVVFISIIFFSNSSISQIDSNEVNAYFNEIALKDEFSGEVLSNPIKWTSDIRIYVKGEKKQYLILELSKIISELNDLIEYINISIVSDSTQSNMPIFFGSMEEYNIIFPYSRKYSNQLGLGSLWTNNNEIYFAKIFVDTKNHLSISEEKHVLREELTQ